VRPESIAYFRSGIGNLIQATPAMQALASLDPSGQIDVCLDRGWMGHDSGAIAVRDILESCPWVHEVLVLEHAAELPSGQYRRGLVPVQSELSEVGKAVLRLSKQPAWPSAPWRVGLLHETWANMRIVRMLYGYRGPTPHKYCPTDPDYPNLSGTPRPIIGVCNGAFGAEMWKKKRWPWWAELCRALKRYWRGSIVAVGGREELAGVPAELITVDYTGRLPILQSARVIAQCDLFITTDTACMHIADALEVPLVALFGPTLASKNGPLSSNAIAVRSPSECAPCQYTERFASCGDYVCMRELRPEMVMRAARSVMNRTYHGAGRARDAAAR